MEEVINKYAGQSKDGYVFPIMDDEEEKKHVTKDYIFKKFRQKLNIWLKDVGNELQCDLICMPMCSDILLLQLRSIMVCL